MHLERKFTACMYVLKICHVAKLIILKINEYFINTINFIIQQMGFTRAIGLSVDETNNQNWNVSK